MYINRNLSAPLTVNVYQSNKMFTIAGLQDHKPLFKSSNCTPATKQERLEIAEIRRFYKTAGYMEY